MKKIFALMLAVLMVVSLAACNNNQETPNVSNPTQDATEQTPGNEYIPDLSEHENVMIGVVGSMEMPYPVMTWAIDPKNPEQVAYYMDADASQITSITLTESAYDMDPALSNNIFSVMLIKVASADVAETVAQDIMDGLKFDRWNGQTVDDVNMKYTVVDDCIVFIVLGKNETAFTVDDLITVFKAGLEGAEITFKPNITYPTPDATQGTENTEGNGNATVVPDDSTDTTENAGTESTENTNTTEATEPSAN